MAAAHDAPSSKQLYQSIDITHPVTGMHNNHAHPRARQVHSRPQRYAHSPRCHRPHISSNLSHVWATSHMPVWEMHVGFPIRYGRRMMFSQGAITITKWHNRLKADIVE